jgi:hypothetical protein
MAHTKYLRRISPSGIISEKKCLAIPPQLTLFVTFEQYNLYVITAAL